MTALARIGRVNHLVAILMAIALALVSTNPAQAIIVRHDVDDAEFLQPEGAYPAVFDVFEKRGGVATLITPSWAITAGHVGQDIKPGHERTIAGQLYLVQQVVLHPKWATANREMALFQLDRPVQNVDPITLYETSDEQGKLVTLVGRGDSGTGLTGPITKDHKLRAATNRVERVEGDMLVFRFDAPDDENTTPLEGISGPGDSGGPALIESSGVSKLAGLSVASSGRPRGTYGNLEFYSRVSLDIDWIQETIASATLANETGSDESSSGSTAKIEAKSAFNLSTLLYAGAIIVAAFILALIIGVIVTSRRSNED
jgi:hypothetical protein